MKWFATAILCAMALVPFIGIFAVIVWSANDWIASALATLTVLAWLAGCLVVAYRRERVRAAAVGALVAGGAYWLLALGPWFSINIGPTLLTSRLLVWASTPSAPAGQLMSIYTSYTPLNYTTGLPVQSGNVLLGDSGIVPTSSQLVLTNPYPQPQPPPANATPRYLAGQWMFIWLFAVTGGSFAWLLSGRASRAAESKGSKPASQPAEDKP